MKDTHPIIATKIRNLMKKKSGKERLMMGFSMFEAARKLAIASLCSKPNRISQANLRKALFLRFYGNEFSPEMRKKMLRSWI
ncbi:MAG: hypothetical protein HYY62_09050 [Deltaproteobacteria bacterium]|nr:hypothetical protein [Deltaproteobacteria bacterium]